MARRESWIFYTDFSDCISSPSTLLNDSVSALEISFNSRTIVEIPWLLFLSIAIITAADVWWQLNLKLNNIFKFNSVRMTHRWNKLIKTESLGCFKGNSSDVQDSWVKKIKYTHFFHLNYQSGSKVNIKRPDLKTKFVPVLTCSRNICRVFKC